MIQSIKMRVLITGSEGQLGQVFVAALKEKGCYVVGLDCQEKSCSLVDEYFNVDITRLESIKAFFTKLDGDIDVLVNNAGVSVFSPFEDRTLDEINYVLDVNVKGNILITQQVFNQIFKIKQKGCIINIGSIYGVCSGDMRLYQDGDRRTPEIYGASKAAVINLTKYFAAYMAPFGVRVNCISPGGIANFQDSSFVEKYEDKVPMRRMGKAQELISTLEYLTSNDSTYVTGQNIVVDGGFTVW